MTCSEWPARPETQRGDSGGLDTLVSRVLLAVATIPPGMVATYGDVARAVGSRAPRAVGRTMALHGSDTHWWRVIPASGLPPTGHELAALTHYLREGTPVRSKDASVPEVRAGHTVGYRVVLSLARHRFPDDEMPPLPGAAGVYS